ncbi:transposase [bacterium]|nr:transposase [bacterium]
MLPTKQDGLHTYRNRLPQWRQDCGNYFVTWCLQNRKMRLSSAEKDEVLKSIEHFHQQQYRLAVSVVMDDHIHLVLQTMPGFELSSILKSMKGRSARAINRYRRSSGVIWQKDSFTELLGNEVSIRSCIDYVSLNPFRKWGVRSYMWLRVYE